MRPILCRNVIRKSFSFLIITVINKSLRPPPKTDHLLTGRIIASANYFYSIILFVLELLGQSIIFLCSLLHLNRKIGIFSKICVVRNGQKKSLPEVQRVQIVILHKEGVSESQFAARLSVSKTGVHQALTKHVSEGIFCDRKRSGRHRKTSIRDDNLIRRVVVRFPTSFTKKLQAALLRKDTRVTQMTISRRLSREFNLKSYKPARKPRLTPVMKAKRQASAKKHRD